MFLICRLEQIICNAFVVHVFDVIAPVGVIVVPLIGFVVARDVALVVPVTIDPESVVPSV